MRNKQDNSPTPAAETRSEFLSRLRHATFLARHPGWALSYGSYRTDAPASTPLGIALGDLERLLELADAANSFASAISKFSENAG